MIKKKKNLVFTQYSVNLKLEVIRGKTLKMWKWKEKRRAYLRKKVGEIRKSKDKIYSQH